MERTILGTGVNNLNRLETDMKTMEPKKLKRLLKVRKLGHDI